MSFNETSIKPKQLIRGIGFGGVALVTLNSVIGSGIFGLPGIVAPLIGALSPWLFLVIGVLIITIVLTLAELSSYFKDSGGPVLFTSTAFGPLTGFTTGWILFVSRFTAFAANSNVMAIYLAAVWPWFGSGIGRASLIVAICSLLTWANYVGVREGVRTMAVITFFKIVPIILLIVLGLQYVSGDTLFPDTMPKLADLGGPTLLLIYAFVGFESATIISGETTQPKKTLPSALIQTVIAIGLLYFLIVLVFISVIPGGGDGTATLTDVGRELMGPTGVIIITMAAFFSIGGNLSSIMLAIPRLPFAMAEKQLLPSWFGHVHEKYSTPSNSILFLGGIGLIFALTGTYVELLLASSLTRLIAYSLCICSLPIVRRKASAEETAEAFRLKGGYTIPAIALALCVWLAAPSDQDAWILTGGLLVLGLVLYALATKQRSENHI